MIQKPFGINLAGITIDATEENEISWSISGDIQVAYEIEILLNSNNTSIYTTGKTTSRSVRHTLPPNTLTNGLEYKISVTAYNQNDESASSDFVIFQTSSRPVITLPSPIQVESFNYNFIANYSQAESVPLRNWSAFLYDENEQLIDSIRIQTSNTIEWLVGNLQSGNHYYIEFQVISTKGLVGTTGKVLVTVSYYRPQITVNLNAKNTPNAGVELSWYVAQIIGISDEATFIDNEKLDTRNTPVYFDEGFSTNEDFTLKVWFEDIPSKKELMTMYGENGTYQLQYDVVLHQFILKKTLNNGLKMEWLSNKVNGNSYFVLIQQIGREINLSAQVLN